MSTEAPRGTYRLQLREEFGFDDLAGQADYLRDLGASHAYLSPVLQATPGSTHGYDVVDHGRLSDDLGGMAAFERLRSRLEEVGLGAVADVVPNHVAVPTPVSLNAPLWSVLREGPESPYARWFDVDWAAQGGDILMPVLGKRIGECLADGEIQLDTSGDEPLVRYYDHVYPVRPGTEHLPLPALLERQYYRLAFWRVADEELNYRRFFDVDTLAGVRMEDPEVFRETHALLARLVREGQLDGLRIDHPDGMADPGGYLRMLAEATDGTWVVVEKILEGDEQLPQDWACAGTTGYDAMLRVCGLFVDPDGEAPLTALYTQLTGEPADFGVVVEQSKRDVVEHGLYAEVARLVELAAQVCHDDIEVRDHTRRGLREALVELLVAFPVYRAYVTPGEEAPPESVRLVEDAAEVARTRLPEERHATLALVRDLVLGRPVGDGRRERRRDEIVVRFQQTCGPVMAKGVEDTAFYRWFRLAGLNEVGGDPAHFGVPVEQFHAWTAASHARWPEAMTTLSTHDTKRSEDVRARLAVLSQVPQRWGEAVTAWRALTAAVRPAELDANTEYLLWQTLVGAWPIAADRLTAYLEKATREAKRHTTWTTPDAAYDAAVKGFAEAVLASPEVRASVEAFVAEVEPHVRAVVLGQKLVQLAMPGAPDVYQGTELVDLSLVDPDNRRPVDYALRRGLLARLDAGEAPEGLDMEKLLVVSRALRLRREHPAWFGAGSTYEPVATSSSHAVAFARSGSVVAVATRLPAAVEREGGWGGATVSLPPGTWTDVLGGADGGVAYEGGEVPLARLLATLPVALLVRS
ncbi:malto-oligosyltrehalose synthase [Vallicoccus soli]|uniref:Malto-oligosyltrehalose synthase n=1 Tax=Vallicoccus soli TaxID=2339232 RepID=A0A3A3YQM3_9ACTN|nr:malto-oligosyltrehalose synthase [Vallicoccus soli]RJK92933.1 malto-oligosyltrehalose synthase [Vallicoccus soli]